MLIGYFTEVVRITAAVDVLLLHVACVRLGKIRHLHPHGISAKFERISQNPAACTAAQQQTTLGWIGGRGHSPLSKRRPRGVPARGEQQQGRGEEESRGIKGKVRKKSGRIREEREEGRKGRVHDSIADETEDEICNADPRM
jgi:hypothetical protein